MNPSGRIERRIILTVAALGLIAGLAKSANELRRLGNDQTIVASPLPVSVAVRPEHPQKELRPTTHLGNLPAAFIGLTLMIATGAFAASALLGRTDSPFTRVLIAGLSIPLGFALHSAAAFALMLFGRLDPNSLVLSVPALNFVVVSLWLASRRRAPGITFSGVPSRTPLSVRNLALVATLALACCAGHVLKRLGGDWDALFFWNARAASIVMAGHDWRWAYVGTIDPAFNDYPLCLPLTTATLWSFAGQMNFVVPIAIAILSLLSIVLIVYAGVGILCSESASIRWPTIAALLLLSLPALYRLVAGQRADLLLTSAMIGSVVAFILATRTADPRHLALSLALAACAAWTKNEGLPFFCLAFAGAVFLMFRRKSAAGLAIRHCLVASSLPLIAVIALKLTISSANDMWTFTPASQPTESTLASRTGEILASITGRLIDYLNLPYLATLLLVMFSARLAIRRAPAVCLTLAFMTIVYFCVFLFTPRDLAWHLEHAEKRLLIHLWPMWVLLLCLSLRDRVPAKSNDQPLQPPSAESVFSTSSSNRR